MRKTRKTLWELFQKSSQEKMNQDNYSRSKVKKKALGDIWETVDLVWRLIRLKGRKKGRHPVQPKFLVQKLSRWCCHKLI